MRNVFLEKPYAKSGGEANLVENYQKTCLYFEVWE